METCGLRNGFLNTNSNAQRQHDNSNSVDGFRPEEEEVPPRILLSGGIAVRLLDISSAPSGFVEAGDVRVAVIVVVVYVKSAPKLFQLTQAGALFVEGSMYRSCRSNGGWFRQSESPVQSTTLRWFPGQ